MREAILVVDDDPPIRRMLDRTLRAEGYAVTTAGDGGEALAGVERSVPDLTILDVAMDGLDGLAVCRRIRAKGLTFPILLLTARDGVPDRVAGLDTGADDYLVKPFATDELLARVRALLRRGRALDVTLSFGTLTLDTESRTLRRDTSTIPLSGREAALLELLIRNARHVVSREQAIAEIWGGAVTSNAVDQYISNLRRKLGDAAQIETVRGVGFVLR